MSIDVLDRLPIAPDRRISYGTHPSHFFDLWKPHGPPLGTAIMIHGGFWRAKYDLHHTSHLCHALAQTGFAVASLEYRRIGHEGGGWPGTFADIRSGATAVRSELGSGPLVVLGHSAGGHLALLLATVQSDLTAVVALAPVACLDSAADLHLSDNAVTEFVGAWPANLVSACPSTVASSVPRALIHGTDDDTVPLSLSREFQKRRHNDAGPVELITIAGANHFSLIDPETKAGGCVLQTVRRYARGGSTRSPS